MKKVLITGEKGYIAKSLRNWLNREAGNYSVDIINLRDESWKERELSNYDAIFHAAAVVHQKEKPKNKKYVFKVNKNLTLELANKGKLAGVSQFIFMSTMSVYGEDGELGEEVVIDSTTPLKPKTFYGISKAEAETELKKLQDENFGVVILRAPTVYGPNCPGRYATLEKIAIRSPVFPLLNNKRSVIHIDNLCQFIKVCIDEQVSGIYWPQNEDYASTSQVVKQLAEKNGKSIYLSKTAGRLVKLFAKKAIPVKKLFGNLVYDIQIDDKMDNSLD